MENPWWAYLLMGLFAAGLQQAMTRKHPKAGKDGIPKDAREDRLIYGTPVRIVFAASIFAIIAWAVIGEWDNLLKPQGVQVGQQANKH